MQVWPQQNGHSHYSTTGGGRTGPVFLEGSVANSYQMAENWTHPLRLPFHSQNSALGDESEMGTKLPAQR